jgi:Fe-S-cluster-containing dehydrogenase component/CRP-like cAMP-binding protein
MRKEPKTGEAPVPPTDTPYRDRWSSYGGNSGLVSLSEKPTPAQLKAFELFREYDDAFLEKLSPDIAIASWKKDAVLFEEGSYIDLAFYLASGSVEISLQKLGDSAAARPIFDRERTRVMTKDRLAALSLSQGAGDQTVFQKQIQKQDKTQIVFLANLDIDLPRAGGKVLTEGEIFGEIGALSGWPQSVTAKTTSECRLVQIRLPALRMMRRKSPALKSRLDQRYRERSLLSQLQATPLFQGCSEAFLNRLMPKVELISCEPDEVITREGEPSEAIFIVRSGFVKLAQKMGEGEIVVSYLSKGMTLGESELLLEGVSGSLFTASSKAYSELVKIPSVVLLDAIKSYPQIEAFLWEQSVARIKETGYSRRHIRQSEFIKTALDEGLVAGNSILVIDLNVCTRCDDCVRGCAATHGDIPRFVREGEKYKNFLITRSCYHCEDPVCLVGCPTGAIHRAQVGDVVEISDSLCIGCQSCANNCPYDAIVMVDTGQKWPQNATPEALRGKARMLATKCDLCYQSKEGPACVNSCPHGCAMRVGSLDAFRKIMGK